MIYLGTTRAETMAMMKYLVPKMAGNLDLLIPTDAQKVD